MGIATHSTLVPNFIVHEHVDQRILHSLIAYYIWHINHT
jgi:hypothetical protein